MVWLDLIIKIGAAASVVGGLIVALRKADKKFDAVVNDITVLKEHSKENYLGIKRLTVMSHDMPIGERIIAGDDYIKAGGNGDVKHYIEKELHINEIQK